MRRAVVLAFNVGISLAVRPVMRNHDLSLAAPRFWIGFLCALPAGHIAAWTINWLLLKLNLEHFH